MSDSITDRIAAIITEHWYDGLLYECWCQRDMPDVDVMCMDRDEHVIHVAGLIIAKLGIGEEWAVAVVHLPQNDYPGATVPVAGPYAFREAAEIDKRNRYSDDCYTIASRLMGPWCEVIGMAAPLSADDIEVEESPR